MIKKNERTHAPERTSRSSLGPALLACATVVLTACSHLGIEPAADLPASEPVASSVNGAPIERPALCAADPAWLAAGRTAALEPPVPPPPLDLIGRLRTQFALERHQDPAVERELAWYAGHPEYLGRVFSRAERYLYHIATELEDRGMPLELALLPVVESAFDPFAYSHGRAAGLWQIIPGTGRRLGLRQNWWYDGRRDVIESTRAALDYLQALHKQFDGDWLLAVAGYNSGEGNVARALRRAREAGTGTDFWSIRADLPRETRTYVPRLLAIATLVADPAEHGIGLPEIPDEPHFTVIGTGGQIDVALAAELAEISTDRLYELNPGVNRWATDPDGPHRLLVPVASTLGFVSGLARLGERERVEWTRHQIEPGQSLIRIAQRYGTTPEVLREVNGLNGNTIRAGQHLMVPHAVKSLSAYTQSVEARTERRQAQARSGQRYEHAVQPGESLWAIARRYGVATRDLASWNAMAPGDVLSVGRELVVWSTQAVGAPAANSNRIRRLTYTVRRGDSLSRISTRFRVSVGDLLQWNNSLSASRYLQPGQQLTVYVDVTEQST
ncbi:MAG: LysM peptidoglycan-binding domain-containing protein [Gammaproteobacteria bacterium]|nr:LysM peptidoglycan-binding domain-containing protein [Gammaproteobacteria bacterium]MDH3508952.1 LysM peptidoglycan-binding domain-containing protein [Gammaproteobacteria bacterium]